MKVDKKKISQLIDKIKGNTVKSDRFPALEGILVKNGYLIAANTEMTVQAKLEADTAETFVIPKKAMDVIRSLPDGDVEITADKNHVVTIKTPAIKNRFASTDPALFPFDKVPEKNDGISIQALSLIPAMQKVYWAAADVNPNPAISSVYFELDGGDLNIVALDGKAISWKWLKTDEDPNLKMDFLIPKASAKKIISLGFSGEIEIWRDANSAVFRSGSLIVTTRLVSHKYFQYRKMFEGDKKIMTVIDRRGLMDAFGRANLCVPDRKPIVMSIRDLDMVIEYKDSTVDFEEILPLEMECDQEIRMGFDPKLIVETLKSYDESSVNIHFIGPKQPVVIDCEGVDQKSLILPVSIAG